MRAESVEHARNRRASSDLISRFISPLMDFILNTEFVMLMVGLCSILSTDPGFVTTESSHLNKFVESPVSVYEAHSKELVPSTCHMPYEFSAEETAIPLQRVRYCGHCKAYVKGFDHHCPAFGNCIGQKNRVLFIILLAGFVLTEASWISDTAKVKILDKTGQLASLSINLATSTMIFSLLQLLWQVMLVNVYRECSWHGIFIVFVLTSELMNGANPKWRRNKVYKSIQQGHSVKCEGVSNCGRITSTACSANFMHGSLLQQDAVSLYSCILVDSYVNFHGSVSSGV
ncbi:hypothetical protein RHGRI_036384 [Rhododendron griersonianum]|uniref:S-acyltransferase n=1 Tax=Rhododendron griersonianum TaxID=479676 RepID=A0AAV6HQU8_9ERIC|nr:hypothetical protein RHGRI_036384 [Rhododendron griersonianum]